MQYTCYNEIGLNVMVLGLGFKPLDLGLPPHVVGFNKKWIKKFLMNITCFSSN
jgi:hypothetical protein